MKEDAVTRPSHYAALRPEPITVIEGWNLGYRLGNVLKYIARHRSKGALIQDLKKARWYLDREIAAIEAGETVPNPLNVAPPVVVDGDKCPSGNVAHTHSWNVPLSAPPLGDDYAGPK
jgi:hypothetical protein